MQGIPKKFSRKKILSVVKKKFGEAFPCYLLRRCFYPTPSTSFVIKSVN